ncbi:MAG TPA: T9SS type A sorting domain-containing protein, partial [Prolixibacteraceae bacterium]|nr:T9SS type A sorting domain-containing protein [Prolixibacteraceae bacterium]
TYEAGLLATDNFQIYTTLLSDDEGYEMEIQSLPDNQYESLVIPVGVDLPQGGMVTFRMDGIILPKDIIPVLEDRLLRVNTYMPDNSHSYTASLSKNSYGTGRFYIRFGSATPISPIVKDLIHLSARYANSKITIFGAAGRNTTAIVYDINGRKLGEYRLDNESRNDIPAQDLVTGVYLLSIKGDRGTQVIKLPVLKE